MLSSPNTIGLPDAAFGVPSATVALPAGDVPLAAGSLFAGGFVPPPPPLLEQADRSRPATATAPIAAGIRSRAVMSSPSTAERLRAPAGRVRRWSGQAEEE